MQFITCRSVGCGKQFNDVDEDRGYCLDCERMRYENVFHQGTPPVFDMGREAVMLRRVG